MHKILKDIDVRLCWHVREHKYITASKKFDAKSHSAIIDHKFRLKAALNRDEDT